MKQPKTIYLCANITISANKQYLKQFNTLQTNELWLV